MIDVGIFMGWPFAYLTWVFHGYFADDRKRVVNALRAGLLSAFSALLSVCALVLVAVVIAAAASR